MMMRTGGAERDRTVDPLLAKQVLSQLSYRPKFVALQGDPNPSFIQKGFEDKVEHADRLRRP